MIRVLLSLCLLIMFQGASAMSIFKPGKTCVFSKVNAVLTENGTPLSNVKVVRKWEWKDLKEETTTTDENGRFEFPAVFESSATRLLPVELVIAQGLYVVINGEEQKIWSNSKREPEENAEYGGKPISLMCELTNELKIYRDQGSRMRTLCSWEEL